MSSKVVESHYVKGETTPDILKKGKINSSKIAFWAQNGDDGDRWNVLSKKDEKTWTSSDDEHPSLTLQFKKHQFTLEHILIGSVSSLPIVEFCVYAYNGTNWECILECETDNYKKDPVSSFVWEIDHDFQGKTFYGLCIESRRGKFTLTQVALYGTATKSDKEIPKSVYMKPKEFKPLEMPKVVNAERSPDKKTKSKDIFTKMKQFYGPDIRGFVSIWTADEDGYERRNILFDNEKLWRMKKDNTGLTLHFPDYAIELKSFRVKLTTPFLHSWYLLGVEDNNDKFDVLGAFENKDEAEGKKMSCDILSPYNSKKYKVLKFVSTSGAFGLIRLELFGNAHFNDTQIDKSIINIVPPTREIKKVANGGEDPDEYDTKSASDKSDDDSDKKEKKKKKKIDGKIVAEFSKDDPDGEDLLKKAHIKAPDIAFWSQGGDSGERWHVLSDDPKKVWTSSPKSEHPSLTLQFSAYMFNLTQIGLGSCSSHPLTEFCVFGFNGSHWDFILKVNTKKYKKEETSTFLWEIPEEYRNTNYYGICIESRAGQFCLHRIALYGSVEAADRKYPKSNYTSISFKPPEMPEVIESNKEKEIDIFERAQKVYGPDITGFVGLWTSEVDGYDRENVLSDNKKTWKMCKGSTTITFYFKEYGIQLDEYWLQLAEPFISEWTLVGHTENSEEFDVIGVFTNADEEEGKTKSCTIEEPFKSRKYRVLKFISKAGEYGLQRIQLFGKAYYDNKVIDKKYLSTVPTSRQIKDMKKKQE